MLHPFWVPLVVLDQCVPTPRNGQCGNSPRSWPPPLTVNTGRVRPVAPNPSAPMSGRRSRPVPKPRDADTPINPAPTRDGRAPVRIGGRLAGDASACPGPDRRVAGLGAAVAGAGLARGAGHGAAIGAGVG